MLHAGDIDPLPWWLDYLDLARKWNVPPWELIDDWTPRRFWIECQWMLDRVLRNVAPKGADD